MSYSDFDLRQVKQRLGINLVESKGLFAPIEAFNVNPYFIATLEETVPLARAINTEKARSELIIANVLVELRKILKHKISLFSGVEFNVDKSRGLNGFCDFLITASEQQLLINSPIIVVVEAKNENIIGGLGQCIAGMFAARLFNQEENSELLTLVYGIVTSGTVWKFLKMDAVSVYIDLDEYPIEAHAKIMGILLAMVKQIA